MLHAPTSDEVTTDSCLSMIATPAITSVPTPDGVTAAAPPITQHVRNVMARLLMQKHEQNSTPTLCTPTAVPPAAQVGGGPVAEAVARHFALQAERKAAKHPGQSSYTFAPFEHSTASFVRILPLLCAGPPPPKEM